jgi:chemotaxis protein methyltransferase CheR
VKEIMKQLGYGDYLRFRDLVSRQSGLYFPEKKRDDLAHGLYKALQNRPQFHDNLSAYYQYLERAETSEARAELDRLINLLTIGETHFFRDRAQFDALNNHVLPALLERKREAATAAGSDTPQIRVWSAGCATGEEAYSLAILLREAIPDIERWRVMILATDINSDSLTHARQAIYSDWSFRERRALAMRPLYFSKIGQGYQLQDEIRQMVTFAQHNLVEDDFPAAVNNTIAMDMIMCRNVTIYFAEQATRRLVEKFYAALNNTGWLIVGHSEPSLFNYHNYQIHRLPGTILNQKNGQCSATAHAQSPPKTAEISRPVSKDSERQPEGMKAGETFQPKPRKAVQTRPKPPRRTGLLTLASMDSTDSWQLDPYRAARKLLSEGHIERAIVTLEGAMPVFPTSQRPYAYCLLARAYADQGDWQQARHWCLKAIHLDKLLAEAYLVLSMVDEQEGHVPQAIANLKKAIYLDRELPLAHFHLAVLYRKHGEWEQAGRALKNSEKILANWPADEIIPDSGGTCAGTLLAAVRQMQGAAETMTKED